MAVFAAVDFVCCGAQLLLHFFAEFIPALEVAGTDLALFAGLIAGPLARDTAFYFGPVRQRKYKILSGLCRFLGRGSFGFCSHRVSSRPASIPRTAPLELFSQSSCYSRPEGV